MENHTNDMLRRQYGGELRCLSLQEIFRGRMPYMSPEQLEGRDAGPRTDIFAFGAVLYEMVTGKRAFDAQ
jgi:serine/threonine protein kinase